jgi:hypothetical protein
MASPFSQKTLKKILNEMIVKFQHDFVFKNGFSQLLTILYPSLYTLFLKSFGTADVSIFHTTVQVYTANSIISLMSSEGKSLRLFNEKYPVKIAALFVATVLNHLREIGFSECPTDETLILKRNHYSIAKNRVFNLFRDLEYITSDCFFCLKLICETVDKGMVFNIFLNRTFLV